MHLGEMLSIRYPRLVQWGQLCRRGAHRPPRADLWLPSSSFDPIPRVCSL